MGNRNEERLSGSPALQADPPTTPGSLEWVTPTDLVPLPTKGKYYPEDHPLCGKEEIELKQMTAKEEDILSNKKLLKNGTAIDKMLESLLVDKRIKLGSLYIGDKNAMILAARVEGYGPDYDAKIICPHCGETAKHTFDLSKVELKYDFADEIGTDGTFSFSLPKTKLEVVCKLLTGADEKWITDLTKSKKDKDLPETMILDQMCAFVSSIHGVSDKGQIRKFLSMMPALDSKFLRKKYKETVPNVDMKQDFTCSECDTSQEVDVPFTAEFFWPK